MSPADDPTQGQGFLSRWSRRKAQARTGVPEAPPKAPTGSAAAATATATEAVNAPSPSAASPAAQAACDAPAPPAPAAPAPPTLQDVQALGRESDFSRFVARDVDPTVRNAALKKLFADPHFNVMDGLDVYIDDYGKPDPLPHAMLREMVQSRSLGLFSQEQGPPDSPVAASEAIKASTPHRDPAPNPDPPPECRTATTAPAPADEDPDLRLQQDDAAGRAGPGRGAVADPGREP